MDALLRRQWVEDAGGISAIPICDIEDRRTAFHEHYGYRLPFWDGNLLDYEGLCAALEVFQPEAVVHLGEMPSAAYSMIDAAHATFTQHNNVIGNLNLLWAIKERCPDAHLIKLGTMGEYGTPNIDIPEGFYETEFRGRTDRLPFPRQAGSFYHLSKVHDSHNTMLACKIWGLCSTDIMQGIVFGTQIDEMGDDVRQRSRLDFDQCFGTVINRFCCQAVVEHPLTLYGKGGQTRGFLPLRDSMQCLAIVVENPPVEGEYRVFNQFQDCYALDELAQIVQDIGASCGLRVELQHYDNPRQEAESHYYNPDRDKLVALGYVPTHGVAAEVEIMLKDLMPYRSRIQTSLETFVPDIHWNGRRQRSTALKGAKTE
jgi:UDP-sulfoquinovose synthase